MRRAGSAAAPPLPFLGAAGRACPLHKGTGPRQVRAPSALSVPEKGAVAAGAGREERRGGGASLPSLSAAPASGDRRGRAVGRRRGGGRTCAGARQALPFPFRLLASQTARPVCPVPGEAAAAAGSAGGEGGTVRGWGHRARGGGGDVSRRQVGAEVRG